MIVSMFKRILQYGFAVLFLLWTASFASGAELSVPETYGTIQAAVDASSDGDIILVSSGTYTENVNIRNSVEIRSRSGAQTTIVHPLNTESYAFRVRTDNVTIEGFTVAGGTIAGAAAILVNPEVRGCRLIGNIIGTPAVSNVYGINLAGCHDSYLENNICQNNTQYGIVMTQSTGNTLIRNTIQSNGTYGLLVYNSSNNEIIENTFTQNATRAIVLTQISENNLISGNVIHDSYSGIRVWTASNNRIIGNTMTNGTSHAILIDHDSTGNEVSGNLCQGFVYGAGVQLWDTGVNTISGNTFSQNNVGVGLQNTTDCIISDNICMLNTDSGITASYASQNNRIFNNQLIDGTDMGFGLYDALNNEIYSNVISNNAGEGIGVFSSGTNTIYQNTVSGNNYGMMINNSTDNRIFMNSFSGNNQQIYSINSQNIWQSELAISYIHQGVPFSHVLGNYYTGHDLTDANNDGIADNPYDLPGTEPDDAFPLSQNHENYLMTPGDLDADSDVDGKDLAEFAAALAEEILTADLNADGMVDSADVEVFAQNFGK